MNAKRCLLVVLGFAVSLVVLRGTSRADPAEEYCCLCTGCSAGASQQCFPIAAGGTETANCGFVCGTQNCQLLQVLEGSCLLAANVAACGPSPAPAAAQSGLLVRGVLLAGGGIYLTRRRTAG